MMPFPDPDTAPFEPCIPFDSTDVRRKILIEDGYKASQTFEYDILVREAWYRNGHLIGDFETAFRKCMEDRRTKEAAIKFLEEEGYRVSIKCAEYGFRMDLLMAIGRIAGIATAICIMYLAITHIVLGVK